MSALSLELVKNVLSRAQESEGVPKRIASLGYPDLLVPEDYVRDTFGESIYGQLEFHPDSASILRWHNAADRLNRVIEARHFFGLLGFELEVVDIVQARGNEILMDLNHPCPQEFHGRYALVIDSGTCEHCFNIAQAAANLASMAAVGGYVIQGNPLNWFNHGFYNLNPTWYQDFYTANGFEIELLKCVSGTLFEPIVLDVPTAQRFWGIPENSNMLMMARKLRHQVPVWPTQTKYVANPLLRG